MYSLFLPRLSPPAFHCVFFSIPYCAWDSELSPLTTTAKNINNVIFFATYTHLHNHFLLMNDYKVFFIPAVCTSFKIRNFEIK